MRVARTLGLAAAFLVVLAAGLWVGGHPAKMPEALRDVFVDESAGLTAEATELIEDNYYRPVSQDKLINSSLQGMVRGLRRHYSDRFSDYFSPEALARFNEEIEGHFSGIGLSVSGVKSGLRVERVFKGSPADAAGIAVGDTVVSVDGHSIAGLDSNAATDLIKGPEGSEVTVGVRDPGGRKTRQVRLTRAQISLPVVSSKIETVHGRKLGYARLATFSEGSSVALRRAVRRLQGQGAEGLVLDLRGNGGGLIREAITVASIFIAHGTIMSAVERGEGRRVYDAHGDAIAAHIPLVVLVDHGTASSAEIVTAALQDHGRAKVVGVRTHGKGVFQLTLPLSNGGALDISIGEFFTPDGRNLGPGGGDGAGVAPNVDVPESASKDEALSVAERTVAEEVKPRQGQG